MPESGTYLAYAPELEQPAENEAVVIDELSRVMQHITRTLASRYRHAYRPVHAKSHGCAGGNAGCSAGTAGAAGAGNLRRSAVSIQ